MRTCKRWRAAWVLAGAACVSAWSEPAHSQAQDQAAARVLFEDGRELMKAGQPVAACPKFEAANKLYPSAGILLNLGDCYEKVGRTASAWTEFGEAASVAARTNRPNEIAEATRRQAALEGRLVRLVIRVPHDIPGLAIKRDASVIAPAAWGAAIPVDPGTHDVRAEAPGYESWTVSIDLSSPGRTETVDVPVLRPMPSSRPSAPALPAPAAGALHATRDADTLPKSPPPSRALAWLLIGGGAAVGIGGGALMVVESLRANDTRTHHDPTAWDALQTPWTIGLVGAIAGGAAAAGGFIVLATSGGPRDANVSLWLAPVPGGLRLGGTL